MMHRFALLAAVAVTLFAPLTALAAAPRTFVASNGSDTWPCTRTQPCRSFATAIGKTSANGEVLVLDSAGYGPFTVAQSISVIAPSGVYAGITVTSGTGITINGSGIVVTLRGLSINGQGGQWGIRFTQGARLTVESCEISSMATHGIVVEAVDGRAVIQDTVLRDNHEAVLAYSTAGTLRVSIVDSKILNNTYGVESYALHRQFRGDGVALDGDGTRRGASRLCRPGLRGLDPVRRQYAHLQLHRVLFWGSMRWRMRHLHSREQHGGVFRHPRQRGRAHALLRESDVCLATTREMEA